MLTGAGTILSLHHIAAGCGKTVPVTGTSPAEGLAFDLIGGGGSAEQEIGWKVGSGKFHGSHLGTVNCNDVMVASIALGLADLKNMSALYIRKAVAVSSYKPTDFDDEKLF